MPLVTNLAPAYLTDPAPYVDTFAADEFAAAVEDIRDTMLAAIGDDWVSPGPIRAGIDKLGTLANEWANTDTMRMREMVDDYLDDPEGLRAVIDDEIVDMIWPAVVYLEERYGRDVVLPWRE